MRRLGIPLLLGALAGALAAMQPISDTDVWWHLATGRETLAHGIVRADLFSWTVRGAAVSTDQWLGQLLLYVSYLVAGWSGIALIRVALVVVLITVVALGAASPDVAERALGADDRREHGAERERPMDVRPQADDRHARGERPRAPGAAATQ